MLPHITIGIALCNIVADLVFGLACLYLYDVIRHSSLLQDEFRTVVRRLIGSIGLFVIPAAVYLLDIEKSANKAEPYAFVWGACYVISLLLLAAGLITLIRDANRERKTGFYRFRRR
jgi:hypothetical protein